MSASPIDADPLASVAPAAILNSVHSRTWYYYFSKATGVAFLTVIALCSFGAIFTAFVASVMDGLGVGDPVYWPIIGAAAVFAVFCSVKASLYVWSD